MTATRPEPAPVPVPTVTAVPAPAPAVGTLLLGSTPSGVRISLDGNYLLTTQAGQLFKVGNVAAGQRRLQATMEGYEAWEQVVEVVPNREVRVMAEL